jgi:hypothetical protein
VDQTLNVKVLRRKKTNVPTQGYFFGEKDIQQWASLRTFAPIAGGIGIVEFVSFSANLDIHGIHSFAGYLCLPETIIGFRIFIYVHTITLINVRFWQRSLSLFAVTCFLGRLTITTFSAFRLSRLQLGRYCFHKLDDTKSSTLDPAFFVVASPVVAVPLAASDLLVSVSL